LNSFRRSANNNAEVLTALRSTLVRVKGSLLLVLSRRTRRYCGVDADDVLV
jgi:hypothetical protein